MPPAALVIRLDGKLACDPPLDSKTVLVQIGAAQVGIDSEEREYPDRRGSWPLASGIRNQRHILVVADGPREFPRLRPAGRLLGRQVVGRVQRQLRKQEVLQIVVPHPEPATDHRCLIAKNSRRETRRPGKANHRSQVVLVGSHACARGQGIGALAENDGGRPLLCRVGIDVQHAIAPRRRRTDPRNEVRPVAPGLVRNGRVFKAQSEVQGEILTQLELVLPEEVPGETLGIIHRGAGAERRLVQEAGGEVGETRECERPA